MSIHAAHYEQALSDISACETDLAA
jgi:hypothetical protein